MKKRILILLMGAVLAMGLTACGNGQSTAGTENDLMGSSSATVRFKVGTTTAPDGHYVKGLIQMQSLLEEYSDGEMTLDIYPNSQLGNERDMMENVGMGVQEMALLSTGPIPNFVPDFAILDLPYLFDSAEEAYEVLDGEIGQSLLDQLNSQRIVGLGFWENGFRELTNDDREVVTPDDLKGMKIRTMENNVHIATYETLGATATPMAWGEIFTALSQGTVDGQENPIAIIATSKVYEVQQYCSLIDLFYSPCVLMINEEVYEELSDTQRAALDRAAEEAKDWQRDYSQNYDTEALQVMKDDGVTVTEVDKDLWKSKIDYQAIIEKSGLSVKQEYLDYFLNE